MDAYEGIYINYLYILNTYEGTEYPRIYGLLGFKLLVF